MIHLSRLAIRGGKSIRTRPFHPWPIRGEAEVRAVTEVARNGPWGGLPGTRAAAFAAEFARHHDARHGICVANGTVALEVALKAASVGAGDEVIVPAITFYATASAAIFLNAKPVIVDIDADTYTMDPKAAEAAITRRTRAVLPVHLYGSVADLSALTRTAKRHGLALIEDCAHMHGAKWRGRGVGSWGLAGCFSLQESKAMTCGEGGVITTNDDRVNEICHSLINCGRRREGDRHEFQVLGWNYRLTELQAAIAHVQLRRLRRQTERKAANGAYLTHRLSQISGARPLRLDRRITTPGYYCYVFRYTGEDETGVNRSDFTRALRAEGIPVHGAAYPPLHRFPLYTEQEQRTARRIWGRDVDYSGVRCPNAERAADREACVMPHQVLLGSRRDMDDIADAVEKVLGHVDELREGS